MTSPLVRSAHVATNALHSLIYFAPETEQHLTTTGLQPGRMCYFAGRAAPMGAVSAGVVTATFYNFSPALIARCIPRAWELARPDVVTGARFAAADAALNTLSVHPELSPKEALTACHTALLSTRGAAISIVTIDSASEELIYAGIGNVDGHVACPVDLVDPTPWKRRS